MKRDYAGGASMLIASRTGGRASRFHVLKISGIPDRVDGIHGAGCRFEGLQHSSHNSVTTVREEHRSAVGDRG